MAQKFLFETSFEPKDIAERDAAIPVDVHEATLKAEYAKGFEQGRAEAQAGIDARNTEQLQDLNTKLFDLLEEQKHHRHKVQTLLGEVLKKSLEKLFPALAKAHGLEEILNVVSTTFQEEKPGQEMGVFAHPETVSALSDKLATLEKEEGRSVRFKVTEDPTLSFSDCRITWEGGGLERLSSRLYEEIEQCLDRLKITETIEVPEAKESEDLSAQAAFSSSQEQAEQPQESTEDSSQKADKDDIETIEEVNND